jgi:hypothetical protein
MYDDGSVVCDRPELTRSHMGPGVHEHKSDFTGHTNNRPNSRGGFPSRSNSPNPCRSNSPSGRNLKAIDHTAFVAPHKIDVLGERPQRRKEPSLRSPIGVDIVVDVDLVRTLR